VLTFQYAALNIQILTLAKKNMLAKTALILVVKMKKVNIAKPQMHR
jgi:hypothetical protein